MHDELIDIVNEKDEVIGTTTRKDAYVNLSMIRIVHVFIFNANGEMALQIRSKDLSFCPGHYVTAGSGHVLSSETYQQAGKRELKEELDIDVPLMFEGSERYQQPNGMKKILGVLRGNYDGLLVPHEADVEGARWCSMEELQHMVYRAEPFHPEFLLLLKKRFGIH